MIYFIFLIVPLIPMYFIKDRNKNILLFFLPMYMIAIFLLQGFRLDIGTDYHNYENIFLELTSLNPSFSDYISHLEYGFKVLVLTSSSIGYNYFLMLYSILAGLIFYVSFLRLSKSDKDMLLIMITVFILSGTYFLGFNIIRQFMALSLCFLSFSFLLERKLLPYCFFILLASLFHITALILLPFYFLSGIRFKKTHIILILIIFILFYFIDFLQFAAHLLTDFLPSKIARYISNRNLYLIEGRSGYGIILFLILFLWLSFTYTCLNKNDRKINLLLFMSAFGLFCRVLASRDLVFIRLGYYFTVFDIILIPYLYRLIELRKNKNIFIGFVFLLLGVVFIVSALKNNGIYPYNSILT